MPTEKEKEKQTQAFENLKSMRVALRRLYMSAPKHAWKTKQLLNQLSTYQEIVNGHAHGNTLLQEALVQERQCAATGAGGTWTSQQRQWLYEAYKLVQLLPSFPEAPDGEAENQVRAIKALLKNVGPGNEHLVFESIRGVLYPAEMMAKVDEEEKKKAEAQKKQHEEAIAQAKAATFVVSMPDLKVWDLNAQSPWHLHQVVPEGQEYPGMKMLFSKIPPNAPITWGSCHVWIDKQQVELPTPKPKAFFVHMEWWSAWKKWQMQEKKKAEAEVFEMLQAPATSEKEWKGD